MGVITEENYPEFKKLYEEAVNTDEKSFVFEGQYILTAYAKYMIQYVENKD